MFTVLFVDNNYENFDYNIVDNSSIIFTKCFEQEFLDTFYIKGIKTIYLYKSFEELGPLGIDIDIIVTGTDLDPVMYKDFDGVIYNYRNNTVIDDTGKSEPASFKMLSNILKYLPASNGLIRCNTESYENLSQLIDKNRDMMLVSVEEPQDKFQKTMQKEAEKLRYEENMEKYKQKMRQSSLSNKKSLQKNTNGVSAPKNAKKTDRTDRTDKKK